MWLFDSEVQPAAALKEVRARDPRWLIPEPEAEPGVASVTDLGGGANWGRLFVAAAEPAPIRRHKPWLGAAGFAAKSPRVGASRRRRRQKASPIWK